MCIKCHGVVEDSPCYPIPIRDKILEIMLVIGLLPDDAVFVDGLGGPLLLPLLMVI